MSFLRLGVACAVFNAAGEVLLSHRGDMDMWNLPTGRLDSGELLADAAAREAREETGVVVSVERPVGLYYFAGTQRLNVLFAAVPVGGALVDATDETRANRYFRTDALPDNLFAAYMVPSAADDAARVLHIQTTPRWVLIKLRLKLARRWVENWLRGRPEPKHVRFNVRALGVILDAAGARVLTIDDTLPTVVCTGRAAPWDELRAALPTPALTDFAWVGIVQNPTQNAVIFVFAAQAADSAKLRRGAWMPIAAPTLFANHAEYLAQVKPTYRQDSIWTMVQPQRFNR